MIYHYVINYPKPPYCYSFKASELEYVLIVQSSLSAQ